jgi:predicted kinase
VSRCGLANISRELRGGIVDLFADYKAKVTIIYFETSENEARRRNAKRTSPVPETAIARMMDRWEPPDLTECHNLQVVIN